MYSVSSAGRIEELMETGQLIISLKEVLGEGGLLIDEPMSNHTSFRIGGPADFLIRPRCTEELKASLAILRAHQIPWQVIGNGSNLLVCDDGIAGAVIELSDRFSQLCVDGHHINAQSGALLSAVANQALGASLTGFEFAGGIPGTLGGAVVMNAGAYGGEMKDVIESVTVLTPEGEVVSLDRDQLKLGYRHSIVPERKFIVLGVRLCLKPGDSAVILETTRDLTNRRTSKQPLHLPSAGSTFKRPPGHFAGQLIETSGLKGVRYGDAQVSEKHCGFVVNVGSASCHDVYTLIQLVRRVVLNRFGVDLEPEVKLVGRRFDAASHC